MKIESVHRAHSLHHTQHISSSSDSSDCVWYMATDNHMYYYRALKPVLFFKVLIEPHTTHYAYFIGLFTCYQQATDLLDSVNKVHVQFLWYACGACVFSRNVTFGIFARNHLRLGLLYRVVVSFCFACHAAVKEFNVLVT